MLQPLPKDGGGAGVGWGVLTSWGAACLLEDNQP